MLRDLHDARGAVAAAPAGSHLGQLVTCASYRNAGLLAKEAACVDVYSGGRLILGLGAGWFHEEYRAYGYEYLSGRGAPARPRRNARGGRRLWTEETVEFARRAPSPRRRLLRPQAHPDAAARSGRRRWRAGNLRIAARHADLTNWQVGLEGFVRKSRLLERYCEEIGGPSSR